MRKCLTFPRTESCLEWLKFKCGDNDGEGGGTGIRGKKWNYMKESDHERLCKTLDKEIQEIPLMVVRKMSQMGQDGTIH